MIYGEPKWIQSETLIHHLLAQQESLSLTTAVSSWYNGQLVLQFWHGLVQY